MTRALVLAVFVVLAASPAGASPILGTHSNTQVTANALPSPQPVLDAASSLLQLTGGVLALAGWRKGWNRIRDIEKFGNCARPGSSV